jgi:hypothetical protein
MRATVLRHGGEPILPPIYATIVDGTEDISIRISDQGRFPIDPPRKAEFLTQLEVGAYSYRKSKRLPICFRSHTFAIQCALMVLVCALLG